jgi:outer membrane protein assembly factor BamB
MIRRALLKIATVIILVGSSLPSACTLLPADPADWPYPRHDLANTAANDLSEGQLFKWQLLDQPKELWQVPAPEGYFFGSFFPVAADVDDDGRAEYIIGVNNHQEKVYWLYAFNVEDGSVLWRCNVRDWFHWSTPVIADVDNDGQQDIVLATDSQIMALNGDDASPIWVQLFPGSGMGMTVADVDGDGWVEVVINDYGNPRTIYLLNGQDGSVIWQQETGGSAYNIPTVGDIDGDGRHEILSHSHLYDPSRERELAWDRDGNELWTYLASPSPEQQAQAPPELGYVPDFGYISTSIADFNADGEIEIGWGTRCHYYMLSGEGELLWRVPTVEGYGIWLSHQADGSVKPDIHGTGGPSGYAAATGNLDDDPALEVVLAFGPEYRADYYEITKTTVYAHATPANVIRVLDGRDGSLQWAFEGEYPSPDKLERMHEPILVDLTIDDRLDVLVFSSDGHLYAIRGDTGEQLMSYPISNPNSHLTFVDYENRGLVLYSSYVHAESTSTLHALQIATRAFDIYSPPSQMAIFTLLAITLLSVAGFLVLARWWKSRQ